MIARLFMTPLRASAALLLAIGLAACSASPSPTPSVADSARGSAASASATDSAAPDSSGEPSENLPPFVCSLPVQAAATIGRAQISDIGVGTHPGYDRIVFSFAAGLPEYTMKSASPPFTRDPSGLAMQVEGSSFLQITLHGGTVQTPGGGTSYAGATSFTTRFPTLVDFESGGDFEAVATWYVGMTKNACVRVLTLGGPSRLVIDLQH